MLRDNLVELIEPMLNSAGADPLALYIHTQTPASDDRLPCLKNPRPEGAESSLTESASSPFQAEPAHNQYTGAVLIARTRDTNGKLLPSLGGTNLNWSASGGNGVYYSSGCIGSASTLPTYRVLASPETAR